MMLNHRGFISWIKWEVLPSADNHGEEYMRQFSTPRGYYIGSYVQAHKEAYGSYPYVKPLDPWR